MHKLYANNGENSVNDILACHNMSIKYFVINCIFKKGSILGNLVRFAKYWLKRIDRKYVFTKNAYMYVKRVVK